MKGNQESTVESVIAAAFGEDVHVLGRHPVYGGDINQSYRLALSNGASAFIKCNAKMDMSFFEAEARGLKALRRMDAIGVPKVLGIGTDNRKGTAFLILEYLESAPRISGYGEVFGRELAQLHKGDCRGFAAADDGLPYGFDTNNFIGASPQINTPKANWVDFYRECRLLPQITMAEKYFDARTRKQCATLLDHLDAYITEPKFPSLIHGDLWSGNAVCGPDGKAWILDPAVYVGHFEAELAMTELFGGFPPSFYGAYNEVNAIDGGYRERKDLYALYHLLNHLNLFGGTYYDPVKRILNKYA